MTEYSILLGTVALGSAVSFISVGVVRSFLLVPFP
jgi:hypothetical protein